MRLFFLFSFLAVIICSCSNKRAAPLIFTAFIQLENFDSSQLNNDIKYLKEFSYITDITFISKEDAKKKYIGEEKKDWSNVLDDNPLPDAYEVKINADQFPEEERKRFKSQIMNKIKNCSGIDITSTPIKE